jgi:hypothetical protein
MSKVDGLWEKVQAAFREGTSLKIAETDRKQAEKLVREEKCFWSIDYDHIMAYDRDRGTSRQEEVGSG